MGEEANADAAPPAAKKRATPQSYGVAAEDFVRAWQTCKSAAEVALLLKMPLRCVHSRAYYYRKKGVQLKHFPRGQQEGGVDVTRLNEVLARLHAEAAMGGVP